MVPLIIKALYFFLPAYLANMAPVLIKLKSLKNNPIQKPISKKYFGKNKTWRGLIVGTLVGAITFYIQKLLFSQGFTQLAIIDYTDFTIILGLLLGFGAIIGDLVESYYKRTLDIPAGKPLYFYDQIDFVIGAIIFSMLVYVIPAKVVLILLLISPLLHILFNYLGYLLKIRKTWI